MVDRLSKSELYNTVVAAIRDVGWGVLYLSSPDEHPLRLQVYRDVESYRVRVYIWNLTHGGGRRRPTGEYRIQITGVDQIEPEVGGVTLILGWWPIESVFAAFDYQKHSGPLGASPSFQIAEAALHQAAEHGFAPHNKGNDEIAIAVRPDYLVEYIRNIDQLHSFADTTQTVEVLDALAVAPESVTDDMISQFDQPRQIVLRAVRQRVRDARFRANVLSAYDHQCAMCGMQLELVEAAHIVPVPHPRSTDLVTNGLALCVLHHEAYDGAMIAIDEQYRVLVNLAKLDRLKAVGRDGGYDVFSATLRQPVIHLPGQNTKWPNTEMIRQANQLRGWAELAPDQIRTLV